MSDTNRNAMDENTPIRYAPESKRRERIELNDGLREILIKMSEGNPGALNVLMQLVQNDSSGASGLMQILGLDDMGMRGSQIWVGYKDHCKQDINAFIAAVESRDSAMVATVNASRGVGDAPPAVTHGASFR